MAKQRDRARSAAPLGVLRNRRPFYTRGSSRLSLMLRPQNRAVTGHAIEKCLGKWAAQTCRFGFGSDLRQSEQLLKQTRPEMFYFKSIRDFRLEAHGKSLATLNSRTRQLKLKTAIVLRTGVAGLPAPGQSSIAVQKDFQLHAPAPPVTFPVPQLP